jgi:hypothetical protein
MHRLSLIALVTTVAFLALAAPAGAVTVFVNWTGTVTAAPVGINVGDTITGSYSYDTTAPILETTSTTGVFGTYHDSLFMVSGLSGTFSNNLIRVFNDSSGRDQIDSSCSPGGGTCVPSYLGDVLPGTPIQLFVPFIDSDGSVFSDTSLPASLDPSDFENIFGGRIDLIGADPVRFSVDSFTAVPEPSTLSLSALGLLGLTAARRRRAAAALVHES